MKPVKDFSGYWDPTRNSVRFKWDVSGLGNDRYIYIVGLKDDGGVMKVDMSRNLLFDVTDMSNTSLSGTSMQIPNLRVGVFKMIFCAYSMEQAMNISDEEILLACKNDSNYMTKVMMGRANIAFIVQNSTSDNTKTVKIILKSDSDISEGVLGYKYVVDNCEIITAFPGTVSRGKTVYPPVLIPKGCDLSVVPMESQFSGNLFIEAKKNRLFF